VLRINLLNGVKIECRKCKAEKPLREFTTHRKLNPHGMSGIRFFGRERLCKLCASEISLANIRRVKELVIAGYGAKCNCPGCGVTETAFLCLDHVIPCGTKNRPPQYRAWRDALRRNFPPDYQLLCYNCNCAKAFNAGGCPHTIRTQAVSA